MEAISNMNNTKYDSWWHSNYLRAQLNDFFKRVYYEKLRERLEKLIEEEEQRRKHHEDEHPMTSPATIGLKLV